MSGTGNKNNCFVINFLMYLYICNSIMRELVFLVFLHSSSCRYQYHNLSTGETTWDYPVQQTGSVHQTHLILSTVIQLYH